MLNHVLPHDASTIYPFKYASTPSSSSSSSSLSVAVSSALDTKKADDKTTDGNEVQHIEAKESLRDIIDHLLDTEIVVDTIVSTTDEMNRVVQGGIEGKEGSLVEEKHSDQENNTMTRTQPLKIPPSHNTPSQVTPTHDISSPLSRTNNVVYHASCIWQSNNNNRL